MLYTETIKPHRCEWVGPFTISSVHDVRFTAKGVILHRADQTVIAIDATGESRVVGTYDDHDKVVEVVRAIHALVSSTATVDDIKEE